VNQGTVKWFNTSKGYGFIVPEGGGEDLFVHFSNITGDGYRTLEDGQKVEFELGEGRNGPEAVDVKPM
jgi:CspA family cold shock protein